MHTRSYALVFNDTYVGVHRQRLKAISGVEEFDLAAVASDAR